MSHTLPLPPQETPEPWITDDPQHLQYYICKLELLYEAMAHTLSDRYPQSDIEMRARHDVLNSLLLKMSDMLEEMKGN